MKTSPKFELDESIKLAAEAANQALKNTMNKYKEGNVTDEDDITGILVGQLDSIFDNTIKGDIKWSSTIFRHRRGKAAEEKITGADMLFHVQLSTPELQYSKGVLIQSKRIDDNVNMNKKDYEELKNQCKKMLRFSPSSFVFNYTKSKVNCALAKNIIKSKSESESESKNLNELCDIESYDFFFKFFKCEFGDHSITSSLPQRILYGIESPDNLVFLSGESNS